MEIGFALRHRAFPKSCFWGCFLGNGASLFGIIAYVPVSALVTSSKTPPNQVPKNLLLGSPFPNLGRVNRGYLCGSPFGKGEARLPLLTVSLQHPWGLLRLPLWANGLVYCLLGYVLGWSITWAGLPLRSWVDIFPSFLLLTNSLGKKLFTTISKRIVKKVANRVQ